MAFEPKFKNLVQVYTRSIAQFGPEPLFGTKQQGAWRWMTYSEFGRRTDEFRGGLASLGITKGDRVAVISDNRPEWAMGAYACYGLGAGWVPMYEAQLDKEWAYILKDCGARAVLVANEKIRDRIALLKPEIPSLENIIVMTGQGGAQSLSFDDVLVKGRANVTPITEPDPSDLAGLIYTSGTTGSPKGVMLTHLNFAANVSAIHELFPMATSDRSLSFLPWAHSFGQTVELHGLFSMGASMGIAEAIDKITDNLAEVQPTLLMSVPRIFNKIYDGLQKTLAKEGGLKKLLFEAGMKNEQERKVLRAKGQSSAIMELKHVFFDRIVFSKVRARFGGRLKYAFSGGAAINKDVAEFIDNMGITVYEGYGLTETSPIATANWPGARKIGSVGKALPGIRIELDKVITGDPRNGEIIVHGHNVMKGYYNLPAENEAVFTADGGFRTGDMGFIDDEGFLFITGRIKEQYKLENGKYVSPAPLEEYLKLSPFITNVMIYGDNKPYNVALIVVDTGSIKAWGAENHQSGDVDALLKTDAVKKLFEQELEAHSGAFKQFEKIRKFVLITEDFTSQNDMLTPSLKIKRRVVFKKYGDELVALY